MVCEIARNSAPGAKIPRLVPRDYTTQEDPEAITPYSDVESHLISSPFNGSISDLLGLVPHARWQFPICGDRMIPINIRPRLESGTDAENERRNPWIGLVCLTSKTYHNKAIEFCTLIGHFDQPWNLNSILAITRALETMVLAEEHYVPGTPWNPGSELPVLIWRGALRHCDNEDQMKTALEANGGWVKGGAWNTNFKAHYHPNVHELYGVVSGSSELWLGRGALDDASCGKLIKVNRGDTLTIPAGVSHCSSTATDDYRFIVLFPKGEPHWISVWCDNAEQVVEDIMVARRVPLPTLDPLDGSDGELIRKWSPYYKPKAETAM